MDTTGKIQAFGDTLVNTQRGSFNPLDAKDYLNAFGLIGVWVILFAETGLLLGFFLPGDSLLFLAGVAASSVAEEAVGVKLNLAGLLIGAPLFAIIGAQLGHFLGARFGRAFFDRPNSRLFKQSHVDKAELYFEKYGPAKAVLLARFIPIVRTFGNPVAGILEMPARTFLLWNIVGGILWTDGVILLGYVLGDQLGASFPIDKYLLPIIVVIVALSVSPIAVELLRKRRASRRARADSTN